MPLKPEKRTARFCPFASSHVGAPAYDVNPTIRPRLRGDLLSETIYIKQERMLAGDGSYKIVHYLHYLGGGVLNYPFVGYKDAVDILVNAYGYTIVEGNFELSPGKVIILNTVRGL